MPEDLNNLQDASTMHETNEPNEVPRGGRKKQRKSASTSTFVQSGFASASASASKHGTSTASAKTSSLLASTFASAHVEVSGKSKQQAKPTTSDGMCYVDMDGRLYGMTGGKSSHLSKSKSSITTGKKAISTTSTGSGKGKKVAGPSKRVLSISKRNATEELYATQESQN
ncbi:hypothetical protein REPUB_Repub18cG0015700 [Reevesia pubescens]